MAYLTGVSPALRELVTPTVDVFADGVGFNDGSSTYIDLSADPGNENNVHITFDGVTQHHDTYSISGVRVTFDAAIPTGTAKIEARYAQENRNYTTIADDAVTLAKMASGTDGNVISYDASGNPVAVATGSDGQVLTSAGAGAPPVFEALPAASGWEFVSLTTASSSATVVVSFDAGYDYLTTITDLAPASDGQTFCAEVAVSGPTYRTSDYKSNASVISHAGVSASTYSYARYNLTHDSMGNSTDEQGCMDVTIYDPRGATDTFLIHNGYYQTSLNVPYVSFGGGMHLTAESMTDMKFYFASGNIATGFFKLYRRANA